MSFYEFIHEAYFGVKSGATPTVLYACIVTFFILVIIIICAVIRQAREEGTPEERPDSDKQLPEEIKNDI